MSTQWEVEQKFVVEDAGVLRASLAQQGYRLMGSEQHCDIYFRHPCRDLKTTDEAFRLRTVDDECCMTYKGKRLPGPVKTRPEIELDVNFVQRDSWLQMLQHLGFEPLPPVHKQRHNFSAQTVQPDGSSEIHVTLDEVQRLGSFAELELIVGDAQQLEAASERIQQLAAVLGLTTIQPKSYLSLVLELPAET